MFHMFPVLSRVSPGLTGQISLKNKTPSMPRHGGVEGVSLTWPTAKDRGEPRCGSGLRPARASDRESAYIGCAPLST